MWAGGAACSRRIGCGLHSRASDLKVGSRGSYTLGIGLFVHIHEFTIMNRMNTISEAQMTRQYTHNHLAWLCTGKSFPDQLIAGYP